MTASVTRERPGVTIHATADVAESAAIGAGTRIWHQAQVREGAVLGEECTVGKSAYIDHNVQIGSRVKIQNRASLYCPLTLEDGVFVGPHAVFTNDRLPRAITPDGALKSESDWDVSPTTVRYGASVGAGAIILPGITIGRFALVAAGAVVTRDVPDHGLVIGSPAQQAGYVCVCARRLVESMDGPSGRRWSCAACDRLYEQGQSGLVPL